MNQTWRSLRINLFVVLILFGALLPAIASAAPLVQEPTAKPFDPAGFALGFELVADGFSQPVHVVDPGDDSGRLFVVEQTGAIRIVRDGDVLDEPFLDIGGQVSGAYEQGLLSLAFHPDFAANGRFFIDYTDGDGNTRVERWQISADDPDRADAASAELILGVEQPFPNHNGGLLLFGPDGYLYIGLGDGGSGGDPYGNAQDLSTLLGSILRIDVDTSGDSDDAAFAIPDDNPFVDVPETRPEIWAYGLRNPWRFSFDRETGDLWIGDVGQQEYEEIDFEPADSSGGLNYGWVILEGNECYQSSECDTDGLEAPVVTYSQDFGCSVTGGYVYRGQAIPTLRGVYIYADFCSGLVWGMGRDENDEWAVSAPIETGMSISSFGEDATGELYVADLAGAVYRIVAPSN